MEKKTNYEREDHDTKIVLIFNYITEQYINNNKKAIQELPQENENHQNGNNDKKVALILNKIIEKIENSDFNLEIKINYNILNNLFSFISSKLSLTSDTNLNCTLSVKCIFNENHYYIISIPIQELEKEINIELKSCEEIIGKTKKTINDNNIILQTNGVITYQLQLIFFYSLYKITQKKLTDIKIQEIETKLKDIKISNNLDKCKEIEEIYNNLIKNYKNINLDKRMRKIEEKLQEFRKKLEKVNETLIEKITNDNKNQKIQEELRKKPEDGNQNNIFTTEDKKLEYIESKKEEPENIDNANKVSIEEEKPECIELKNKEQGDKDNPNKVSVEEKKSENTNETLIEKEIYVDKNAYIEPENVDNVNKVNIEEKEKNIYLFLFLIIIYFVYIVCIITFNNEDSNLFKIDLG
jgi:hypothetical protein